MPTTITVLTLLEMKKSGKPIAALTAYDFFTAKFLDKAGIDLILVGDSIEMVLYGAKTTITANIDKIAFHTEAVAKGARHAMVVGDMPFLSYHCSIAETLKNAGRLMQAGAKAVKIEGGAKFADTVRAMVDSGIPVLGHLGMLPQSIHRIGGYIIHGEDEESAEKLMDDALALEQAGVFAIVLEKVYHETAAKLTDFLKIPTIGIGSGVHCDGQILVVNDILGLFDRFEPEFAKKYTDLKPMIIEAAKSYVDDVKDKKFPLK